MDVSEMFDHISNALVCLPGNNITEAATLGIPDPARAASQHRKYVYALQECGIDVATVAADPSLPQACLVGGMAVMTDRLAVIGNSSDTPLRQNAQQTIAAMLAGDRFLKFVTAPGLLDAEDVLRIGNHFYIALSDRTNQEGAAQLAFFLTEFGYEVTMLEQPGDCACRLNASAAFLGRNTLLIREELARHFAFIDFKKIIVPAHMRGVAAAMRINGTALLPAGYAEISAAIRENGIPVIELNISEFEKIGGNVKNLSLRLRNAPESVQIKLCEYEKKAIAV